MSKVMSFNFVEVAWIQLTSRGRTSVDIGASANLELVDKFCYLGDTLT